MSRNIRTTPELRDETQRALANCARRAGCAADAFALEALATLDGLHIGLKDLRTPAPAVGGLPSPGNPYHAAKAALTNRDNQEDQQ